MEQKNQSMTGERIIFLSEGNEIHGVLRRSQRSTGKAVVFCHGAFETQENWTWYAEALNQEGFTTFTFDFVGHGESQGIRSTINLKTWAYNIRDGLNQLDRIGYQSFGLVGFGSGGSGAVLAAAHDRRVACAVILAAPVYLIPPIGERAAFGLVSIAGKVSKAILRKPLTLSRLNELDRLRYVADEAANKAYLASPAVRAAYHAVPLPDSLDSVWVDITRPAEKIHEPVLILQGEQDRILPLDQSQRLFELVSGEKELVRLPGGGHAIHLDQTRDQVYQLISDWMKRYLGLPD